jgi:hypothetical protein
MPWLQPSARLRSIDSRASWAARSKFPWHNTFERDTYTFNFPGTPSELVDLFRTYYGPTMNAFEAAAANGREADLQAELDALFNAKNTSTSDDATSIPATFLRVTVAV